MVVVKFTEKHMTKNMKLITKHTRTQQVYIPLCIQMHCTKMVVVIIVVYVCSSSSSSSSTSDSCSKKSK